MADPGATLLARLAGVVGGAHVLTAPADVEPYLADWRGRYRGAARAVVRPASTEEVAAVVRACAERGTPIVPQGGNTGLCGGGDAATRRATRSSLSLRAHEPRARARRRQRDDDRRGRRARSPRCSRPRPRARACMFPLSLASEGSCTIGGNLSTNAGGTAVLRFGNTRELALGLEVVLADGRVWAGLRGLRKDNTGYDLKQLFIGAEGTLGIVTAAVLKLFPAPRTRATALVAVARRRRGRSRCSRCSSARSATGSSASSS